MGSQKEPGRSEKKAHVAHVCSWGAGQPLGWASPPLQGNLPGNGQSPPRGAAAAQPLARSGGTFPAPGALQHLLCVLSRGTEPGRVLGVPWGLLVPSTARSPFAGLPEPLLCWPGTACCSPPTSSSPPSTRGWGPWRSHRDPRTAWTGAGR